MTMIYFIVPTEDYVPSAPLLDRLRKRGGTIESVVHTGCLADLKHIQSDESEKIL